MKKINYLAAALVFTPLLIKNSAAAETFSKEAIHNLSAQELADSNHNLRGIAEMFRASDGDAAAVPKAPDDASLDLAQKVAAASTLRTNQTKSYTYDDALEIIQLSKIAEQQIRDNILAAEEALRERNRLGSKIAQNLAR